MDEETRKKLNETAREIVNLLGLLNGIEKAASRLKNKLKDDYLKINNELDKENEQNLSADNAG